MLEYFISIVFDIIEVQLIIFDNLLLLSFAFLNFCFSWLLLHDVFQRPWYLLFFLFFVSVRLYIYFLFYYFLLGLRLCLFYIFLFSIHRFFRLLLFLPFLLLHLFFQLLLLLFLLPPIPCFSGFLFFLFLSFKLSCSFLLQCLFFFGSLLLC